MEIWTVKKILDWGIGFFKNKDIPQARLSSELLLAAVLGLTRMELYLNYSRTLKLQELATYKEHILKMLEFVPVQYILGEAHFRNIRLYVNENVLIPRPETELVVEKAVEAALGLLNQRASINILEIGTGSGAIALSLYSEILNSSPRDIARIKITATEISRKALKVAKKNAENILSGDAGAINMIQCDILPGDDTDWSSDNKGKIDMVVSNPPYISESGLNELPREIREYEPKQALVGGETGLEVYERILSKIKDIMRPSSACIIFETDPMVGGKLQDLVKEYLKVKTIILNKDYNQKERILVAYI